MNKILALIGVLAVVVPLKAQELDSIKVGRQFLGMDISPVTVVFMHESRPELYIQYKLALKDPCLRLRLNYQSQVSKSNQVKRVQNGSYYYAGPDYYYVVGVSGQAKIDLLGLGLERVIQKEHYAFIVGGDVVVGRQNEYFKESLVESSFSSDSARAVYFQAHPPALGVSLRSNTLGLAPTAGVELELGERLSLQTSVRFLIAYQSKYHGGFNGLTANQLQQLPSASFRCTGLNILLFYRF